jgi:hypothetical protein
MHLQELDGSVGDMNGSSVRNVLDAVTGCNAAKVPGGIQATASTRVTSDSGSRRTFVALRSNGHYSTPDSRDTILGCGSNGIGDGGPANHNMASSVRHDCNAEALLCVAAAASNAQEEEARGEGADASPSEGVVAKAGCDSKTGAAQKFGGGAAHCMSVCGRD